MIKYKFILETIRARRKPVIFMAVLLLLNVCSYLYLTIYQEPLLESLQNNWFEKRQKISSMAVVDPAMVYEQGTRDLKAWASRIPPKKDFARFLGDLFETAASNNLSVKSVTYKPNLIKDEGLLAYTIGFSVSGNYAAVKSFISDIARSRQIVTIENLSLNNSSSTQEAIELKLQLITYLRVEGA